MTTLKDASQEVMDLLNTLEKKYGFEKAICITNATVTLHSAKIIENKLELINASLESIDDSIIKNKHS